MLYKRNLVLVCTSNIEIIDMYRLSQRQQRHLIITLFQYYSYNDTSTSKRLTYVLIKLQGVAKKRALSKMAYLVYNDYE